jgi:hypothetical protein
MHKVLRRLTDNGQGWYKAGRIPVLLEINGY